VPSDYRDSKDPQLVAKLCGHSAIRRNLVRSRPQIQIHPISFKKLRKTPLIAEVIRCTRNTAIIQAPAYNEHDCAYLLRLQKDDTPSFYIYRKFCYMDKKVHRIKRSVSDIEIDHNTAASAHAHAHTHTQPKDSHEDDYPDFEGSLSQT